MRKIVSGLFITLDGVVEAPTLPGGWALPYINDELNKQIEAGIAKADAILLGPQTYHIFAKIWPQRGNGLPMADFLNNTPKYIASYEPKTVGELEWGPVTLLKGTLTSELAKLKKQPGKDILIPGSPRLVRSLLIDGLLDELRLTICPVVVGSGLRLFDDVNEKLYLKLVTSEQLSTGALSVTYQPDQHN